jgi:hypothetical protein
MTISDYVFCISLCIIFDEELNIIMTLLSYYRFQ